MPDPDGLLAVARVLSAPSTPPPSDAQLRRAVSTAYYALFHKVLRTAADRFMGAGSRGSAGYRLVYRSYQHGRMKRVCEALTAAQLGPSWKAHLGRKAVSQDTRDFAANFVTLQELRHQADYDPSAHFPSFAVAAAVDAADVAMGAFDGIPPDEQADVLALMLADARS